MATNVSGAPAPSSGLGYTPQYAAIVPDQAKVNQPGSLILEDFFKPEAGETSDPHGDVVAYAASREGFQGPIVPITLPTSPALNRTKVDQDQLCQPGQSADDVRKNLALYVTDMERGLLEPATQQLVDLKSSGANHSAVNFSQAGGKARLVDDLYGELIEAWQLEAPPAAGAAPPDPDLLKQATQLLNNYSLAFGLDGDKLRSNDPKVGPPEWAKLNQKLVDFVSQTCDNSQQIKQDQSKYDQAVNGMDAGRVSVVVAGGNDGNVLSLMASQAGGVDPNVPTDFYHNPLSDSETTTVGATRLDLNANNQWVESVAAYSTPSSDITVYDWGSVGTPADPDDVNEYGTSFAAPRVSAAEARLHQIFPNMSNADVAKLLSKDLSTNINSFGQGPVRPVLDDNKVNAFLNGGALQPPS